MLGVGLCGYGAACDGCVDDLGGDDVDGGIPDSSGFGLLGFCCGGWGSRA